MNQKTMVLAAIAVLLIAGIGVVYVVTDTGEETPDTPDVPDTPDTPVTPVEPEKPKTVVDAVGRTVDVPKSLDAGIITIGSGGPLRFLSIFDVYEHVIECDKGDVTDQKNGRAYSYAYPYDQIKEYHADTKISAELVEKIVNKKPALVVVQESVYSSNPDLVNQMGKFATTVVIHGQSMDDFYTSDYKLTQWYKDLVNLLGTVLNMEDRAKEHISDVEAIMKDIRSLVKDDPGSSYIAGVTFRGSNDWCKTFPIYFPLGLTSGINAYTGSVKDVRVDLNAEEAMKYVKAADRIVIDPSSSNKIADQNSQFIMKGIYELNHDSDKSNDKRLFVTLPMVWDFANYDCVLAGAYYLCYLQYGTLTHDQVVDKINMVFEKYYGDHGKNVLKDMAAFFVQKSSDNNVELPLLGEVEIVKNADGTFTTKAL